MVDKHNSTTDPTHPTVYEIRIQGHLGEQWTDWFEGMVITLENDGTTYLCGAITDQSALHGLLKKIRDLGMPLLSVNRIESDSTTD